MQPNYMAYGISHRATALTAAYMQPRPHYADTPGGFTSHFFLDELARHPRGFVARLLGAIALAMLVHSHPDTFGRYTFGPVTPTPLIKDSDNVERLVPPDQRERLLPSRVAVGLSDSALSLVIAVHDDANRAVGMPASIALRTLESYGPDGAATFIGITVLDMLLALHPEAFAPFPNLTDRNNPP